MSEILYFTSPPKKIKFLSPRILEMASAAPTRVFSIGQRKNPGACLVRVETTHALLHLRGNLRKLLKTHCHWLKTLIESTETTHALLESRGNPRKLLKSHYHWQKTLIESTETTQNSLSLANDANRIHGNNPCTSQNL